MKGVMFNLLEEFICEGWGERVYEDILGQCPLHTKEPFIGPHTYPDADLLALVGRAAETLGVPVTDAIQSFGKFAFPRLAAKYPVFLQGHQHPITFLKTIDAVIHVEVRKLLRDADPPRIAVMDAGPDALVLHYASRRALCPLLVGLLEGVAAHFGTPLQHRQTACVRHGAPECVFHLSFSTPAPARV